MARILAGRQWRNGNTFHKEAGSSTVGLLESSETITEGKGPITIPGLQTSEKNTPPYIALHRKIPGPIKDNSENNSNVLEPCSASANRWPASDTVVLRPDSPSLDSAFCTFCASCTHALHLVASGASGDPCLHWVPSGHMQLSNSASHAS